MPNEPVLPKLVECDKCNHRWYCVSQRKFIVCPKCFGSVRNPHYISTEKKDGVPHDRK